MPELLDTKPVATAQNLWRFGPINFIHKTHHATDLIADIDRPEAARGRFESYFGVSTAIVMRDTQVSSPASLVNSICQTWVLRPM